MTNLDEIRDDKGKLPTFAWPGGYPILYLDGDNSTLCPDCANEYIQDEQKNFRPVAYYIHWEGPSEFCEQCNKEVESAYGDPEK